MTITYGGKTVKPEDVEFSLLSNGHEFAIYLFFHGYHEEEARSWGQIGYLLLDEALGEHDVETKVGLIRFFPFDAHAEAARYPLRTAGDVRCALRGTRAQALRNPKQCDCELPLKWRVGPDAYSRAEGDHDPAARHVASLRA
jgi:hypothetical protein